jgi:hypothetical protein
MTYSPLPPRNSIIRLTFVLVDPGGLTRHEQYQTLKKLLTPLMLAHGIYAPMGFISNPLDFRGMGFWLAAMGVTTRIIQRDIASYDSRVECQMWTSQSREYHDKLNRLTWDVREVQVA